MSRAPTNPSIPPSRLGEGTLVDVHISSVVSVDGIDRATLQANVGSLPVPNKRYSADTAFVGYSHGTAKLLFGQEKFATDGELRTLLIVKMSLNWVKAFVQTLTEGKQALRHSPAVERLNIEALPQFTEEPKDTVTFDATMVVTGINGIDGCLDFYYSSPFALERTAQSKKLAVDPVVRVNVRAGLLVGMFDELSRLLEVHKDDILD
jgi:hypothetical protein